VERKTVTKNIVYFVPKLSVRSISNRNTIFLLLRMSAQILKVWLRLWRV